MRVTVGHPMEGRIGTVEAVYPATRDMRRRAYVRVDGAKLGQTIATVYLEVIAGEPGG